MRILFIDKNKRLVDKVKKAIKYLPEEFNVSAKCGDIFKEDGVIVSASNPDFTCGGGLDALIVQKYPDEVKLIQDAKEQQQIRNVMFVCSVDRHIKATRESVSQALKFALNEKNHMATNQTMLVSGLGTGIGGLDEDDFVWLFLKAIIETNKSYGWGIKYTKKDGYDFRTGTKHYIVGEELEEKGATKSDEDCGVGLHLGKSFIGAGNYNLPEKIFFCIYKKKDLCNSSEDKVRVKKLLPLYVCPEWLGYGVNGKKYLKNKNKKVDPEKYNPYTAIKLPSKNKLGWIKKVRAQVWDQVRAQVGAQVWDQVRAQVRDQVGDQVRDQVWDQVWAQVWDQVRDQVRDQVWAQVGAQVWDQVRAQVWAQVGAQVWDQVRDQVRDQVWAQVGAQVWATSYWAVNMHFELGVVHPFFDFLKLGIMAIFVNGKIKIFGKKGRYLGEYNQDEL